MMKFIKKVFLCLIIIAIVITSFAPYQTNAFTTQIVKEGGSKNDGKENGVTVSKIISSAKDSNGNELENYFDIELTVKSHDIVREMTITNDVAVMLVLDVSGSMDYCIDSGSECSVKSNNRITKAVEAIKQFVEQTYNKQQQYPQSVFKIGLITYSNGANVKQSLTQVNSKTQLNSTLDSLKADGGTNLEAALRLAKTEIDKETKINNKYLILLTDGYPTFFSSPDGKKSGCNGNDQYFDGYKACGIGNPYDDTAAIKARENVSAIHRAGIETYMVAVGLDYQNDYHTKKDTKPEVGGTRDYHDKGKYYDYKIVPNDVKNWIKEKIVYSKTAGKKMYYDTKDSDLTKIYDDIFKDISAQIDLLNSLWTTVDPIPDYIQFDGIYNSNGELIKGNGVDSNKTEKNQASYSNNKLNWNLRLSDPVSSQDTDKRNTKGEIIKEYTYKLKYRVRLTNESDGFIENNTYNTNGTTILNYILKKSDEELSEPLSIEYPIPAVKGYLGEIEFDKISDYYENGLEGAKFELSLANSEFNNVYKDEYKHIDFNKKYTATSDKNGKVKFTNIPSGYEYILKEIEAPEGYNIIEKEYNVSVKNNNVVTDITDNKIIDQVEYYELTIKKVVNSKSINENDEFDFKLTLTNDSSSKNTYNYIKTGSDESTNEGTLEVNNHITTFKLKHNESITITLPYGIGYSVEEIVPTGYVVESYDNKKEGTIKTSNVETTITNKRTPKELLVKKYWNKVSDYTKMPIIEVVLQRRIGNNNWEDFKTVQIKSTIENGQVKGGSYNWKELDGDYDYRVRETKVIDADTKEELDYFEVEYDEENGVFKITNTDTRIPEIPETGSSGMLILTIIALMCFAMPIINKVNNFYRYIRAEYM